MFHGNFPQKSKAKPLPSVAAEREMKSFLVSIRDWKYNDLSPSNDNKVRLFARLCHLHSSVPVYTPQGAKISELSVEVYHIVIEILACLKSLMGGSWTVLLQQWEHGDALVRTD